MATSERESLASDSKNTCVVGFRLANGTLVVAADRRTSSLEEQVQMSKYIMLPGMHFIAVPGGFDYNPTRVCSEEPSGYQGGDFKRSYCISATGPPVPIQGNAVFQKHGHFVQATANEACFVTYRVACLSFLKARRYNHKNVFVLPHLLQLQIVRASYRPC